MSKPVQPVRRAAFSAACLFLLIGAAGCGERSEEAEVSDATAVILTRLPTLHAQMTQSAPTLQSQLTQNAPTIQAIMTLMAQGVEATYENSTPGATPTLTASGAAMGGDASTPGGATGGTTPTSAASGGSTGDYDITGTTESGFPIYGEGYPTTKVERIVLGGSASGMMSDAEAHNYLFDGTAGQKITIKVTASGGSDPRLRLIDPHGNGLANDDDGGGGTSALLTVTLPETGTYTIRIDMWVGGGYSLTVS